MLSIFFDLGVVLSCLCPFRCCFKGSSGSSEEPLLSGAGGASFGSVRKMRGNIRGEFAEGAHGSISTFNSEGRVYAIKLPQKGKGNHHLIHEREILEGLRLQEGEFAPVVQLRGVFETAEKVGLVFDLYAMSLADYIDGHGPSPVGSVCYIAHQLVQALIFLKSRGVTHGDINPRNILLNRDSSIAVTDFEGAVTEESGHDVTCYSTNYIPPEFLLEIDKKNPSIDVWGAAVSICELYAKNLLFSGDSEDIVMLNQEARLDFSYDTLATTLGEGLVSARGVHRLNQIQDKVLASHRLEPFLLKKRGENTVDRRFLSFVSKGLEPNPHLRIGAESWFADPFFSKKA